MSDLATGRTPSFSAAESIALYASSRRTWAKAAQREWKGLTSRLGKHRADVADSAGAAAPDPPAAASGTLGCELPFKFHSPWLKRRLVSAAAILSSYRLMSDLAAGRPGSACEAGVASPGDAPAAASKTGDELPFIHSPCHTRRRRFASARRQHPISSCFCLSQVRYSWLFHEFFPEQICLCNQTCWLIEQNRYRIFTREDVCVYSTLCFEQIRESIYRVEKRP